MIKQETDSTSMCNVCVSTIHNSQSTEMMMMIIEMSDLVYNLMVTFQVEPFHILQSDVQDAPESAIA